MLCLLRFLNIPYVQADPNTIQTKKYADAADSAFKLMLTDPPLHIYLLRSTLTLLQPLENCFQLFLVERQVW